MDAVKFRGLVQQVSGKDITTEQAKNFLELFIEDYNEVVNFASRSFVEKHFGKKNK